MKRALAAALALVSCTELKPNVLIPAALDAGAPDAGEACTAPAGARTRTLHADPRATGDETGDARCPFRTITAAIAGARRGDTIAIAPGTYDEAHGERFPLDARGLSLIGAGSLRTIVIGAGFHARHPIDERPDVNGYQVTILAGDPELTTEIASMTVQAPEGPTNFGVLCDRGVTGGRGAPDPPPNTIARDLHMIGQNNAFAVVWPEETSLSGCSLAVRSSTISDGAGVSWVHGTGYEGSRPVSLVFENNLVERCRATAGVNLVASVRSAVLRDNHFRDNGAAITVNGYVPAGAPDPHVEIRGNLFERHTDAAVRLRERAHVQRLEDNTITGGNAGIAVDVEDPQGSPLVERARRNRVVGNQVALRVSGPATLSLPLDFGTARDPGDNVLRCSAQGDVVVDLPTTATISLAGNLWDHAPPEPGTDLRARADAKLVLEGARAGAEPCPPGRDR